MSFPRYPKYKDSGVEWLGGVPEHWGVAPLKRLARFTNGAAFKPTEWAESGYPIIRIENLNGGETFNHFDGEPEDRHLVYDGDLLFGWSGNRGTSFGPYRWRRGQVCVLNQHIFNVTSDLIETNDLYWILKAVTAHVEDQAHGIIGMVHVTKGDLGAIKVPAPSSCEQKAISLFLDRETAKIDALIAEQQRLIELLREKRQAVISHAVTKGLNPDAAMKDSGIEWLGEVPEHWRVVRLGHCGRLQNGLSIGGEAFGTGDPFVSYGDVYNNANVPEVPSGLVRSTAEDQRKCGLEVGDVLFTRTSETVDDIGIASTSLRSIPRATFAGFLIRFRPYEGTLDPGYSTYLFRNQGVKEHFAGTMNIVTRASLSQGELRSLPICLPPLSEQTAIAGAIDSQTEQVRSLLAHTEQTIALLQERRSALISAAVTGQIDVRGLAGSEAA
jgi:type I restriction enzyme S subunit